jgi:hypothetical protein
MTPRAPNATSSEKRSVTTQDDLDLARRLSRSLSAAPAAAPAPVASMTPPPGATPWARFGVAPHGPRVMSVGAEGWKRLLADVISLTHARGAFLIDESGLLVAGSGVERDDAEGMGSRLVVAFGQLDQMAGRVCRTVSVDLGSMTVTGFRGASGAGGVVTPRGDDGGDDSRCHALGRGGVAPADGATEAHASLNDAPKALQVRRRTPRHERAFENSMVRERCRVSSWSTTRQCGYASRAGPSCSTRRCCATGRW